MTTTPLASDSEAEAAPTSRRDRQQAEPADRAATAPPPTSRARRSRSPPAAAAGRLRRPGQLEEAGDAQQCLTYRPPEFDAETRAVLEAEAAEREAADRAAAARREADRPKATLVPAEPRTAVAAEPVLA